MNKLKELSNIGFQVTWKVMSIGLFGTQYIPVQLSRAELFEYLDELLCYENEQTDNVIALICERDNETKVDKQLRNLAMLDGSNLSIQLRKWRAFLLMQILNNISKDTLQGLLELMDFWVSIGISDNCPHIFPDQNNLLSSKDYFTSSMYNKLIEKNRTWLNNEIAYIIEYEKS